MLNDVFRAFPPVRYNSNSFAGMSAMWLESFISSWPQMLMFGIPIYLLLVQFLRFRRANAMVKRFAPAGRDSYHGMTTEDAQTILKTLAELEFPKLYSASMIIAIIRTYGIPSISSVLVQSGQLSHVDNASKRATDTGALLLEFGLNKPTSNRAIEAIARTNYLHSKWQRAGKITNDE